MKWYKAIVDLKDHRKRYELEAELNTIHGLHYIHCWFSHVAKFFETGDCSKLTPAELARACEWKGEPQVIFDAFLKCGFIDKNLVGNLTVHNWFKENARFLKENGKEIPLGKPVGKPRVTRGKTVLQDSTVHTIQYTHKDPAALNGGDLIKEFLNFRKGVTEYQESPYALTGRDRGAARDLAKAKVDLKTVAAALPQFFASPARFTGGHSAAAFFGRFNEFTGSGSQGAFGSGVFPERSGHNNSAAPGYSRAEGQGNSQAPFRGNNRKIGLGEGSLANADPLKGSS